MVEWRDSISGSSGAAAALTRSSLFMQWYVEMLHLINESDRGGEGEAQPGNGPKERGQIKWGICLLQGEKKKSC